MAIRLNGRSDVSQFKSRVALPGMNFKLPSEGAAQDGKREAALIKRRLA